MLHIYFKANKIPDPKDGRILLLNEALKSVFKTDQMTIFTLQRLLTSHLTPLPDLDAKPVTVGVDVNDVDVDDEVEDEVDDGDGEVDGDDGNYASLDGDKNNNDDGDDYA